MSRARSRVFRYRIDVISVLVVLLALGAQLAAFFLKLPWFTFVFIVVLMRWTQLAEHNHAHLPIFRSRSLNEAIGWIMFLNGGVPLEAYRVYHVETHHRYTNREGDWTSPFAYAGTRFPDKPVNLLYYVLTYSVISLCHVVVELLRRPNSPAARGFLASIGVVGAASAYLIHHDPWRFLLFFYLTWWVAYLSGPIANWLQHDACEFGDPFTSANVNLSILCRTLGFNVGYHSAHHMKPTLHWSRLARFHWTRVAPHVPGRYYWPIAPERALRLQQR